MTERTTINIPKQRHKNASKVKEEHDETWSDVLAFYQHFRDEFPESPRYDATVTVGEDVCNDGVGEQVVIEEVTIQTEKSGVSASEVDGIIEAWVERNYKALQQGEYA